MYNFSTCLGLSLLEESTDKRLKVECRIDGYLLPCLIDSGANIPMFYGRELFLSLFKNRCRFLRSDTIHGIGGDLNVSIYVVDKFVFSDLYGHNLYFNNILFAVTDEPNSFPLLLCMSVFFYFDVLVRMYAKCTFISGSRNSITLRFDNKELSVFALNV